MRIETVFATLLAAGGLGYINYAVAEAQGLIDFKKGDNLTLSYMLSWSVVDFAIYLGVSQVLSVWLHLRGQLGLALSLLATMGVVLILSVRFMSPLHKIGRFLSNLIRSYEGKSANYTGNVWNQALGSGKTQQVYVFNFEKHLLAAGEPELVTHDTEDQLEMSLRPLPVNFDDPYPWNVDYDELAGSLSQDEFQKKNKVRQFMDLDRKIIVFIVESN